jgi:murein DD-endopeptidase MepM/ murein hydrolase activator NlpD
MWNPGERSPPAVSARPSPPSQFTLAVCVIALAAGACQPPPEFRRSPPPLTVRPAPSAWIPPLQAEPDLDEAQALAWAARTVILLLPLDERRRILEPWLPPPSTPVLATALSPVSGLELAFAPAAPRREVELLQVMRELHAVHGTRVLTLSAFFLGPEPVARARKRLRLAPERISVSAISRVLRRRERPLLRYVSEAERWATLAGLGWPVERTWRISSRFGPRIHPIVGGLSQHRGVDLSMPVGTEVRAPSGGIVTKVRQGPINGNWLELDHGDGVRTQYCHLSLVEVKRGQQVKAGERVALSGDTGRVTGPHLHYQVKLADDFLDPLGSRAPLQLVGAPLQLTPEPLATLPRDLPQ